MTYGKTIPGLELDGNIVNYGVLNERDARAGAGIMLILGIFAFSTALFLKSYILLTAIVSLFFVEFLIRIINPHYAPLYALGRLFVSKQTPEWSGAIQKRFAWSLGLAMAGIMLVAAVFMGVRGVLPFTICSICLVLMWLESALGICLGCKMYYGFMRLGWVKKPSVMPACPGGACPINKH